MADRFEHLTLSGWATNEPFEIRIALTLQKTRLRQPSVLFAKSLQRTLQISEDNTGNLFHLAYTLAIDAIRRGQETITDAAGERWALEFDVQVAFARDGGTPATVARNDGSSRR